MQDFPPPAPRATNGLGTAGFILSLIGLLFFWVPIIDFILWLLGFIFSVVAVFKAPRGLAITGIVLSFINGIIMLAFMGAAILSFAALI